MVDAQVLTSLNEKSILATPPDETSLMCYQLPGEITLSGEPILGGTDINTTDRVFARQIYPPPGNGLHDTTLRSDYSKAKAGDETHFLQEPVFLS